MTSVRRPAGRLGATRKADCLSATCWSGLSTRARRPVCRRPSGFDLTVVVVCQEGYTSSLAAAALQDLGLRHATDVDGGYLAWHAAGLPVAHEEALS